MSAYVNGGTPVLTKDGLKPIEELKEGELVASRNDKTGEVEWKPVTARFINDDDRITYALILVNEQGEEEQYEVTDNHPFNVDGLGWVDSIDLKPGMKIPSYHGGYLTVKSITSLNRSPKTYNVEVGDFHTYFVGEQGAWVHNQCSCDYGKLTDYVQGKQIRDPYTNQMRDPFPGEKIAGDHIYPRKSIERLRGFDDLKPTDMKKMVEDLDNVQPLPMPHNQSKSNRAPDNQKGPWERSLGEDLHPDYIDWLKTEQLFQKQRLQDRIDDILDTYDD